MAKNKKCRKARFGNREDAFFWGPPYHCDNCQAYHITHFDRRILWGRLGVWTAALIGVLYALWVMLLVALGFGK